MGKYLYLIKETRKKEREGIEKLRKTLMGNIQSSLSEFSKIVTFKDAYIFGSITNSKTFSNYSDIDIAFYGLKEEKYHPSSSEGKKIFQRKSKGHCSGASRKSKNRRSSG